MTEAEELPDHLRCKRTDGRQWRCNRRVMDDKKLCDIHHLQGRHRQYKKKVPESLKLQRRGKKFRSGRNDNNAPAENGEIRGNREEKLGNFAKLMRKRKVLNMKKRKKKRKTSNGEGLQMELIRMVLKREVEKNNRKRKKVEMESETGEVNGDDHDHDELEEVEEDGSDSGSEEGELMRDLPNGLMAISPAKNFSNVGGCDGGSCSSSSPREVKIGGGGGEFSAVTRRCFRSKNIEPLPIGTLQVLPYKKDAMKLRRGKRRKCHWCRRSGLKTLIKCSSCQKEFFCLDCIKEQYFDMQEEVKMACPVCRGTCSCKACSAMQYRDIECKGFSRDKNKVDKVLHLHYFICMLLPVLKQINQDHCIELEIEAKIKGKKPSDVQIEASCKKQCCCNNCKTLIVDFHRSCPNCSYNLCLICCRDIFHGSLPGSIKALLCKCPNRSITCTRGKRHSDMKSLCSLRPCYGNKYLGSYSLSPKWKGLRGNRGIPCPSSESGGCGDNFLDLRCLFPLRWMKELEISAEEIVGCYDLPETLDISSCCSLCLGMDCEASEIKQLQVAATREDTHDNILYYPSALDVHNDNLEHFQKHWGKGHPVIVRNVLQGSSDLSWDPIIMFCTYLKNNAAKPETEEASLDWFEVEIGVRQLFMGSFKGLSHGNMWHEKLKLKGWLSSHLFQEHFPAHYAEVLHTLPLPEYTDPTSGVLNVAAELPQELLKPDLGPNVYISYVCGENLVQADSVTKLRYDSYDVVNILAHTTDVPVSTEQLNYIRKLMKKHKEQNKGSDEVPLDGKNLGLELQDMVTEEVNIHKRVARASWFSATTHEACTLGLHNRDTLNDEEHDSDSDTDTDTEVSQFFFGPVKSCRTSGNNLHGKHTEYSDNFRNRELAETCGAEWDIFRRQDVPKLLEYLKRHSNEFPHTYGFQKHVVHPILDQKFFLDTTHKMRLKEEFKIEPWTFEQHVGEAVIIPAGCPYQIRNLKSCVSVVLDFISPENVTECIQLNEELRLLPDNHKAKLDSLEVKKMSLHSISRAIKEIRQLTCKD